MFDIKREHGLTGEVCIPPNTATASSRHIWSHLRTIFDPQPLSDRSCSPWNDFSQHSEGWNGVAYSSALYDNYVQTASVSDTSATPKSLIKEQQLASPYEALVSPCGSFATMALNEDSGRPTIPDFF